MFTLKKDKNRPFIVLNLTDPQLSDEEWKDKNRASALLCNTVKELIDRTNPDLITVTGDVAWAGQMESYDKFFDMLDSYKLPWAVVWGNHDNQGGDEQTEKQAELLLKHKYCLYEKGDKKLGNGNYTIAIEENGRVIYGIIMMDSHDRMPITGNDGEESSDWAHLLPEQLDWYKKEADALGDCNNALFMHIPIYGYRYAFERAWNNEYQPAEVSASDSSDEKYWNDGYKGSFGVKYEDICSYSKDLGEYDSIKACGKADLFVAGHDHINNFVIEHEGMQFVYGLKTGCGCYWKEKLSGGTVIRITADKRTVEHVYVESDYSTDIFDKN